jgi:hypothetical protein
MLKKEQIRQIISEIIEQHPDIAKEDRTPHHLLAGEMIAKKVLQYLWPDQKIEMPGDMGVMVLHKFDDIPMDAVFLNKEFNQLNLENVVSSDRPPSQFTKQEQSKFYVTTKNQPTLVFLRTTSPELKYKLFCVSMETNESILSTFNLNALQVGIDVLEEKLYFTKEFEDFVNTKQLYVTSIFNPNSTIIDLIVMANTIPCYCDINEELLLLAQPYYYNKVTHLTVDVVTYEEYQRANSYFPNLFKYFSYDKKEQTISPKEDTLPQETRLLDIASEDFQMFLNYWKLYKRNSVSKSNREKFDKIFTFTFTKYYILANLEYYDFKKEPVVVEMKHLDDMLIKHPSLNKLISEIGIHEQLIFCETIRDYMRQYNEWVIGFLETNDKLFKEGNVIDYNKITELLEKEVKRLNEPLIETLDLREFKYRSYVEELHTPLKLQVEGKKMHHCVGGYSNQVESGQSRIFHIETDNLTLSTLEIGVSGKDDNMSFSVRQHKNVNNKEPEAENIKIAKELVEFLSKKFGS